ncbi:MAG TPA: UbiA family prenyltransferase [Chitinophagales bacterium]|nr:UbiA family prenyltransferase [Chitinophagales bacterium]HRK27444.1 UbiA family prenyltransferase [Chitinophagales bacterium]
MYGSINRFYRRLQEAWRYKAPTLVSVPYWFAFIGQLSIGQTLWAMAASYTTIIGIAAFGYFVNDYADIQQDAQAGKPNSVAKLTTVQRITVLSITLLVALVPWLYLPLTPLNAPFLAAQFGLFMAYSLPPLRLKERGFAGILADALYAHVNPAVLAALTFYLLIPAPFGQLPAYLALLAGWQLLWGLGNILHHQTQDAQADAAAGAKTFALQTGIAKVTNIREQWLLPLEWVVYLCFLLFLAKNGLGTSGAVVCLALGLMQAALLGYNKQLPAGKTSGLFFVLHRQYLVWLPLVMLIGLANRQLIFAAMLPVHFIAFPQASAQVWNLVNLLFTFLYHRLPLPYYTLSQMLSEAKLKIARLLTPRNKK